MEPDPERHLTWHQLVDLLVSPVAVADAGGQVLAASAGFTRLVDSDQLAHRVPALLQQPPRDPVSEGPGDDVVVTVLRSRAGVDLTTRVRVVRSGPDSSGWCLLQVDDPDAGGRDALTGLVSREVLILRAGQALAHRARHGGDVEVIVVDLDHFKSINDRHGHLAGDEVLVEVARRLSAASRPEDTVARWGGDEFVLLLDDTGDSGELVCERITASMARPFTTSGGTPLVVTASCGTVRAEPEDDTATLLHSADMQMYEHKRRGRSGPGRESDLSARLARAQARAQELHDALGDTMRRARECAHDPRTR